MVDAEEVPRHLQFLNSKASALRELNKDLGHISSASHVRSTRQASFLSGAANGFVRGTRALVRNAQKRVSGDRRGKELKIVSVLRNILRTPFKSENKNNRRQHNRPKKFRAGPSPQHRPHHNQRNPRIPLPFTNNKKHHHKRQNHKRKKAPPPSFALTAPDPPQPSQNPPPPRRQTFPNGPRQISTFSNPPKRNAGPINVPDQVTSFTRVPEQGSRLVVEAAPEPQTHQVVFKAPEQTFSNVVLQDQDPSFRENPQIITHNPQQSSNYQAVSDSQQTRFNPPEPHQIIQMTDLGANSPTVQSVEEPRYNVIEPIPNVEPIPTVEDNFIYDLTTDGGDADVVPEGLLPGDRVTLSTYEADELYRSQPYLFRSEKLVQDIQPEVVHENHQYDIQDINLLSQAVQAAQAVRDNSGNDYSSYDDAQDINLFSPNSIDNSGNNAYDAQNNNIQDNTLASQYESYDNIEDKDLLSPDIPDNAVTYKYVQFNENDHNLYPPGNPQVGQINPVTIHTPLSKGSTGIQSNPGLETFLVDYNDYGPEEKSLEVDISPEDFNASINRVITDSDFVSQSYERLLDQKIEEIKREAAKLEQTYWGGKSNDFGIKK